MSFMKFGELSVVGPSNIQSFDSVFCDAAIEERFKKFAKELKRIAPKADDFLYFSAIMMHAAESSAINADGSVKLTSSGEPVVVGWERKGESFKWVSNDPKIKPYANNNGDIFPESELIIAAPLWKNKPLCINHRSSSVDDIRGIILDTYYDRTMKRIIALCALDKATYPDLAKKITLGYSTNFSMGTAVGRAICMACGNVAKVESEFCHHMKTKTGGGEINASLAPLEFSIVVTPADPKAKLRTIIAAANTVNSQLEQQEKELSGITPDQLDKLNNLEASLKDANEKLGELKELIESNDASETAPYGQSGDLDQPVDEKDQSVGLNFPERYATNEVYMSEVRNLTASLENRLLNMEKILDKLNKNKEDSMNKEAYYQGGGGVNEPTPGQKKYPVDPKNEDLRMKDKHMNGESPFPEVGSVDGMHPSPASVSEKDELKRKELLSRAERRSAALEKAKENVMNYKKEAYYQGGGGVNEPTPGKVKYPADKLNETDRLKEDKHMNGQKPFPGVGAVDGLHPSPLSADEKDELKRKEMLSRASLKAKFVRVANVDGTDNQADSAWQVYAKDENGEKLVFSASVDEISGGRSDALFSSIATKEFGTKMLEKIRTVGLVKAASVYKKAQAVAGPAATPGLPADMGGAGAGAAPAMPEALPAAGPSDAAPEDDGGKGDPKEVANKLAEKVRDLSSDLLEAVRSLTGEQAQMGEMEDGLEALPKSASATLSPLYKMRRELNSALVSGIKKSLAELKEHAEELDLIESVAGSDTSMDPEYINTIAEDAFSDVKSAIADASGLMKGVSKYARGTVGLLKRAEEVEQTAFLSLAEDDENDARKKAKKKKESEEESKSSEEDKSSADDELFDFDNMLDNDDFGDTEMGHEEEHQGGDDDLDLGTHDEGMGDELPEEHTDEDFDLDGMEEMPTDDMNDTMVELPPGTPVPSGAKAVSEGTKTAFDLTTRAGRTAYRAKLAGDATGKEDSGEHTDESKLPHPSEYDEAHKLTDGQTELDVKPSGDLGYVENELEQHKRDMEVAKMEPKVREASRLNQLIAEGKVKAADLDTLVAQGLDADVVKYWKQYYGEAGKEGSEFAKLLTTETMKAKAEEDYKTYRIKLARAYELANEMVRCGTLSNDRSSISSQVDEIMKWNDDAFESCKRVIAKQTAQTVKKQASHMPQVGMIGSGDTLTQNPNSVDLQSELETAFSGRRY